jgi:FxLD family lantipeptide
MLLATPTATSTTESADVLEDWEFDLDMRVVEATTPLTIMMCDTSDNCGSTCGTSACSTSSLDPS